MPDPVFDRPRAVARRAGTVLAASLLAAAAIAPAAADVPRSKDDRGFSILLVSPTDPYLSGRQSMRIESIIPRGDNLEEVDFFVDGRLLLVAQGEPYSCDHDFGPDIRRHVIEVRALTHEGRRAKVSFVSRSVDVIEGAAGGVATIAAVVRNPAGRPVSLLGVSDFVLTEDSQRRSIVHFSGGPSPAALAVVLDAQVRSGGPVETLTSFLRDLPEHQVVTLVGGPAGSGGAEGTAGSGGPTADQVAPAQPESAWRKPEALSAALQQGLPARTATLAADLDAAAALLAQRREPRVLVLIVTLEIPPPPPAAPGEATPGDAAASGAAPGKASPEAAATGEPPVKRAAPPEPKAKPPHNATPLPPAEAPSADDLLAAGLESALKARAAIYVIGVGPSDASVPAALRDAAARSGGQFLLAPDLPVVPQALRSVSEALRNRYLITFMPAEPGKAGWHVLDLAVRQPDLAVQAPKTLAFP